MTDEPIDLQSVKTTREIIADKVRWDIAYNRLLQTMLEANLTDNGLTQAALHALLDILKLDMDLQQAKKFISDRLRMFQ